VQAIILAGGLGTRLRPLVGDVAKPMAPVAGRPFMEYLLRQLRQAGFEQVLVCAGYRAGDIEAHFGSGERFGVQLAYSVEPEPLGTAGALRLAADRLAIDRRVDDRWLVLNGDSLLDISLVRLVDAHRRSGALLTMALVAVEEAGRYGRVELAEDGTVASFVEKNAVAPGPGLINGGVYVMEPSVITGITAGEVKSLERDVLPGLVGRGLHGVAHDAFFIDIGVPEDYQRAQQLVGGLSLAAE
jgi:NDP-sugar pyrophosphorylase family protein